MNSAQVLLLALGAPWQGAALNEVCSECGQLCLLPSSDFSAEISELVTNISA